MHLLSVIPSPPFQPSWYRSLILVNNQSQKSPYSVLAMSSLTSFSLFLCSSVLFGEGLAFDRGENWHKGVHWEFYAVLWVMVFSLFSPRQYCVWYGVVPDSGWALSLWWELWRSRVPLSVALAREEIMILYVRWGLFIPHGTPRSWTEHCSSASSACGARVHL